MPQIQIPKRKPVVVSLGGSMIVPNGGPNVDFLKALKRFTDRQIKKGRSFVYVTGGGKTARHYINAADKIRSIAREDLDWLGIHATRLNGHLLRTIFREVAHPVVQKNPTRVPKDWDGNVMIAAGWKPGWSTDYVAARIAKRLGSRMILNASDIDHVYDEDPRKNKDAKPLEQLKWRAYRAMVGDKWDPGLSAPFDPVASKFCARYDISAIIVHGENFQNMARLLDGRRFTGTVIEK